MKWKGSNRMVHRSRCSSCFLKSIFPLFRRYHEGRPRATLQQKMFLFNFHRLVRPDSINVSGNSIKVVFLGTLIISCLIKCHKKRPLYTVLLDVSIFGKGTLKINGGLPYLSVRAIIS
jgi:hypothetical protein